MTDTVNEEARSRQLEYIERLKNIVSEKEKKIERKLKACVVTFGCQMNERDSEKLKGILMSAGYELTDNEEADFVIYNTCTVRENADLRVFGRLGQLSKLKKKNNEMVIALCGCMAQEDHIVEKLKKSYPSVDIIFGTYNVYKLAELLYTHLTSGNRVIDIWEERAEFVELLPTERKYKFKSGVNIMYGCNNFCTYCIVPYVRGRETSRSSDEIIKEIENLVKTGVVEVCLLGQNVNSYGKGSDNECTFPELLQMVEKIEGLERIRFMTSHPKDLSDELIKVMSESKKICKHIHLPVQSGSSDILNKMNRKYDKDRYLELVSKIRRAIPDISITTDIIVGFPGETEEDFEETLDVVRKSRFDSAFTFEYSKRTGTPAATYKDEVPKEVVKERFQRLLNLVKEIGRENTESIVGGVYDVLVECENDHEDGYVTGRLSNNMLVHFKGDRSMIGQIKTVKINESKGFYFFGSEVKNDFSDDAALS